MMRKPLTFCTIALLYIFSHGKIIDIQHINEINQYTDSSTNTLVIFDIDNTILEPTSAEGGDQWFYAAINHFKKQGLSYQEAYDKVMPIYTKLSKKNGVKLVEKEVVSIIHRLQKHKFLVIALTSRSQPIKETTINQLTSLNINLSNKQFDNKNFSFNLKIPASFKSGILFCGDNDKGEILTKFLEQTSSKPNLIIFIDDKKQYLTSVKVALNKNNIPFIGLRYGYLDNKVNNFVFNKQTLSMKNF